MAEVVKAVSEFFAFCQWNNTIGLTMQFDKRRQMFDLDDHRIRHTTVQDHYRR
jgi:hypothetical protein